MHMLELDLKLMSHFKLWGSTASTLVNSIMLLCELLKCAKYRKKNKHLQQETTTKVNENLTTEWLTETLHDHCEGLGSGSI